MNILTVSNDTGLLAALSGVPEELFPDAAITRGTNPLMAGKFSFHHEVDILLARCRHEAYRRYAVLVQDAKGSRSGG